MNSNVVSGLLKGAATGIALVGGTGTCVYLTAKGIKYAKEDFGKGRIWEGMKDVFGIGGCVCVGGTLVKIYTSIVAPTCGTFTEEGLKAIADAVNAAK